MKIITITGLDGTGKTTQVKWLSSKLNNSSVVSVWDIISKPEYRDWSIYRIPPDVERYVMNLHPTSRSLFIFHAFNEAYQRAIESNADFLIFDSYWYKYFAIEQAMGTPKSFSQFLSKQYVDADLTFCLELADEVVIQRKKEISFYEGGSIDEVSIDKFKSIQGKAKIILDTFLPINTVYIDASQTIETIQELLWLHVSSKFNL